MTSMPQYAKCTKPQLQRILKERRLPITGTKEVLVARLIDDDSYNPFPFLKLPGEIRNKIYKYMAAFEKPPKKGAVKSAVESRELPRHVCASDIQNQTSIAQPSIFHACSQIYRESRAFFYRYREFKLRIWQEPGKKRYSRCFRKVFEWLNTIGVEMQLEIRTLEIDLQCDTSADMKAYIWFVDNLHARLSEEATVIYRPTSQMRARHEVAHLWYIGKVLHSRDRNRVPQLEHPNWSINPDWSIRDLDTLETAANIWANTKNPLVYTPKKVNVDRPSLTFRPNEGWFGKKVGIGFT